MSVYKEAVYCLRTIENAQKRIYPDACDFGAPTKIGDGIWNSTKQLVDWYKVPGTRKVEKYSTGTTVTEHVTFMPDEHNSSKFVTYRVTYTTIRGHKDMDGYVYVELIK